MINDRKSVNNTREAYYDIIRVIAMFAVIGVHSFGSIAAYAKGDTQLFLKLIIINFNDLGVPLFFALSGCFLLRSVPDDIYGWYKKRFTKILIPYFCYGIGYVLYFGVVEQHDILKVPLLYAKGLICSDMHPTHWFVYAILGLYFATPFIAKMFHHMSEREVELLFYGIVFVEVFSWLFSRIGWSFAFSDIVFNASPTKYFVLGYMMLRLKDSTIISVIRRSKGTITIAILLAYLLTGASVLLTLSVAVLLIPRDFADGKNNVIVSSMSEYSYNVYLIHAAVISLLLKIYDKWEGSTPVFLIKAIVFYFVTWLISYVIALITKPIIDVVIRLVNGIRPAIIHKEM